MCLRVEPVGTERLLKPHVIGRLVAVSLALAATTKLGVVSGMI